MERKVERVRGASIGWTATPRVLAELKNAMLKMRDSADIRLLRFAELAQRLEQALPGEKFGESDARTAVLSCVVSAVILIERATLFS